MNIYDPYALYHLSICTYLPPPRHPQSMFMELRPAESFVDWDAVRWIPGQENSETKEQENKQDARGQNSEQLGTGRDGDGPCVFTAARHQRGLKLKLNLHNMDEIFPSR